MFVSPARRTNPPESSDRLDEVGNDCHCFDRLQLRHINACPQSPVVGFGAGLGAELIIGSEAQLALGARRSPWAGRMST